jgi:hypothetical protein
MPGREQAVAQAFAERDSRMVFALDAIGGEVKGEPKTETPGGNNRSLRGRVTPALDRITTTASAPRGGSGPRQCYDGAGAKMLDFEVSSLYGYPRSHRIAVRLDS